ncbi:MAG TPA: twin-arginine translocase subunit TatC [Bryobacteraceae bacterium]|nr:twin-arginine translocase subunit TatC [Bryobacteraceae bacterium]
MSEPSLRLEGADEAGLLRMSFMEHLEELRARILKALWGFGAIFLVCVLFSYPLFKIVERPGLIALKNTGVPGAHFVQTNVMESFSIIWVWTPVVAAMFLGSPWILWQAWAFIAPGLYERERRWAVPFLLCTAGLFIAGGLFGYFVAFPYSMSFLFGIGSPADILPLITIDDYFDKFVDVLLGIGLAFELPVLIFFLSLLRVVSPAFLLNHSRYAIIVILVVASLATPSPDAFTMMLFAAPMCMLFFLGIFASYLLVLRREHRRFPWKAFLTWVAVTMALVAFAALIAVVEFQHHLTWRPPLLVK